jgi:hypothetical protein
MKRIMLLGFFVFSIFLIGCAGSTFTATGGPAVFANLANDLRNQGTIKTSPGGFAYRNKDAQLGALINQDRGVSKDVEIFVQGEQNLWTPYGGSAEVLTPGRVYEYEGEKWVKKNSPKWLKVDGLEAIHFESPFSQRVTLRLRDENSKAREIMFDTFGRQENGSVYERINVLFIKLPLGQYRFNVYSYTGQFVFKAAEGRPYTNSLYIDGNPTDYQIGNQWVGWILYL